MRHQGIISKWNDEKGYGFIVQASGGKNVFVHIKSFTNRQRRPVDNESVTYDVRTDSKGRLRAVNVAFEEYKATPNYLPDETLPAIAGFFEQNGKVIAATLMILFFSVVVAFGLRGATPHVEDFVDNAQVQGQGIVTRILSDDNDGDRHQRFILRLPSGQTVMIAHNIDIAPRLNSLREGDTIAFYGIYNWHPDGGVVHWTHRDPRGRHLSGWLQHNGRTYQ